MDGDYSGALLPQCMNSDGRGLGGAGGEDVEQRREGRTGGAFERARSEPGGIGDCEADALQVTLARDAGDVAWVARRSDRPPSPALNDSIAIAFAGPVELYRQHLVEPAGQPVGAVALRSRNNDRPSAARPVDRRLQHVAVP